MELNQTAPPDVPKVVSAFIEEYPKSIASIYLLKRYFVLTRTPDYKEAVKIGGGVNHRIGLFDMILLKDNHVDFAGGITAALDRCHNYLKEKGLDLKVEIEVRNFAELDEALAHGGADRVMLDNFSVEDTRKAVEHVAGRVELESSGGITIDTLRQYAECGVDYISVGALTHSVKSLDMSFKAF